MHRGILESFPHYRLSHTQLQEFLKHLFGERDFRIQVIRDDFVFDVPRKLTSDEREQLLAQRFTEHVFTGMVQPVTDPSVKKHTSKGKDLQDNVIDGVSLGTESDSNIAPTQVHRDIDFVAKRIASCLLEHPNLDFLLTKALEKPKEKTFSFFFVDMTGLIRRYINEVQRIAAGTDFTLIARELVGEEVPIALYLSEYLLEKETIQASTRHAETRKSGKQPAASGSNRAIPQVIWKDEFVWFKDEFTSTRGSVNIESFAIDDATLKRFTSFILSNTESRNYLQALISRLVYSDPLQAVEDQIWKTDDLEEESLFTFHIDWELSAYIEQEIKGSAASSADLGVLGSLLVISGRKNKFYMNTCEKYMLWKWPDTAEALLRALKTGSSVCEFDNLRNLIKFSSHPNGDILTSFASYRFHKLIAEQLLWLTASFRLPRHGQLCYSDSVIIALKIDVYTISTIPLEEANIGEDACWPSLLRGSAIARDYPVPTRENEKGLELPFHLMITLAGPVEPRLVDGGIYFQGYSRVLFPTYDYCQLGSLQWHLEATGDRRVALPDDKMDEIQWTKIRNPDEFVRRRTFLGHYRRAFVDLGTEKPLDYYGSIENMFANTERHRPRVKVPSSLDVRASILGVLSFGATFPIIPKALACNIEGQNDDFKDILEFRSKNL